MTYQDDFTLPTEYLEQLSEQGTEYLPELIRIWEAHTNDEKTWRASLERPGLKERVGFSNIDELFAFIKEDMVNKDSGEVDET